MSGAQRIRPPLWLKLFNKIFIPMLRLGLGPQGPVVLTVPGRKSGKPCSTLVTPMTCNGRRYVVSGFPGADWRLNVRAAGEVTLRRGRHTERIRLVETTAEDARPVLRAFPAQVPVGVAIMKSVGLITDGAPDEFAAMAGYFPVFRLDSAT